MNDKTQVRLAKKFLFFVLFAALLSACMTSSGRLDRKSIVARHKIISVHDNPQSPAQVGNGEFAFGMDLTGLQTFTAHNTLSHWGWHSFPLPEGADVADFKGQIWDTHGRDIMYWIGNDEQRALSEWLAGNPHRFNLGRIGFVLKHRDGTPVAVEDLMNARQETDLWTGVVVSYFEIDSVPVSVTTVCHADDDAVGVKVVSPLLADGQIEIEIAFPYPVLAGSEATMGDYGHPSSHRTRLNRVGDRSAELLRTLDDVEYRVAVNWSSKATLTERSPHVFRLSPEDGVFALVCNFAGDKPMNDKLQFDDCLKSSVAGWRAFWESGAAIDLSGSQDSRWSELERRIVLSQYVMRLNEAGSYPPQESGLVNNGWYGRFHFEMIWWHEVHYALWNRWELFAKCQHVFSDYLPTSVERAKSQGYRGARWAKCTGNIDREWPHPIDALLIWQQPHPIYYAELDYRQRPTRATLDKWRDIVFATADFMADYAFFDTVAGRYVLGPPMYVVSETTDPKVTINPTFELSYWRFGLRTAQLWKERLAQPRDEKWDDVLNRLSPLPIDDSVYVTYKGIPDMWGKYAYEHPALIGVLGMLPGDGVDTATFKRTLERVYAKWDFKWTWGWDFPMLAMAAARNGQTEKAIDFLLFPGKAFHFDEHGLATGGPFPYFPSNGALLTAVAMMTGGWDGSTGDTPGFPKNGQWSVKHEGFNRMP
jgi:hypothetical protein